MLINIFLGSWSTKPSFKIREIYAFILKLKKLINDDCCKGNLLWEYLHTFSKRLLRFYGKFNLGKHVYTELVAVYLDKQQEATEI